MTQKKIEIKLNVVVIPMVDSTKFLGVYIDAKLSWDYHIKAVEGKLSKNIGIIFRLSKVVPADTCNHKMLYSTLVLPYLSLYPCLGQCL